jgi:hypothetical protein
MNHGPKFQKVSWQPSIMSWTKLTIQLMAEIKADVREMQARGNYGDGELSDPRYGAKLTDRFLV